MNISNSALFSGTNTSTLVINALTTSLNQNRFRCVVSSSCGIPATSTTAILDVIPGNPNSLSIPDSTICPNVNNASLSIPIVANAFTDVAAMTFDLKLSSGITFTGISNLNSSLSGLNSNVINGKIRISWFSQNNISVPNGTELFKLNITASGPGAIEWDSIYQFFFDEYNGERLTNVSNGSINTFPSITPTITPLNSICENASPITLIANPSGGVFSGLGVVNGRFDPSLTGAGFHNITYTYTTNQGCSFSTTTSLFVSALPNGNAGSDVEICPGSSVVLSATGGTSYMWSNGIATDVNPVSPMFTTFYTVNIFNASGCFITDTVLVTVSSGNGIQIAAGDSISICFGDSITLSTNGATQAIWYPANGLSSTNSLNPVANPSVTTTYYIIGTNNSGCYSTDSVVVVVNPNPTLTFSLPNTICSNGAPITLSASPPGGTFSGPGVTSGSRCNGCPPEFVPSSAGIGLHTITYNYTDPITGCSASVNQTIEVLSTPTASAGINQTICSGSGAILTATGGISYAWNNGATTPTISVNPTSTTVYSVNVTSANGCISTEQVTVFVNPRPAIQFSGDTAICVGGSTSVNITGVSSVIWSPSVGVSNPFSLSPILNPSNTTTYTVYGTDVNGCTNTGTVTIFVRPSLIISAGQDIISCGSPVTLTASGANGVTYSWNNGQSGSAISVNPNVTSNYIVTGTDSNGCTGYDTITVHVPTLFTGGTRNVCRGATTQLSASLSNYPGNVSSLIYQWFPTTGLSDPNTANPVATSSQTTVYNVSITDPASNCVFGGSVVVLVLPTPVVDLGADLVVAPGGAINLAAAVTNISSGTVYSWSLIGAQSGILTPSGNSSNATFIGNSTLTTQIQRIALLVSNFNGCLGSDTIEITIDPTLGGKNVSGSVVYANTIQSIVNSGSVRLIGPSGTIRTSTITPGGNYLFTGVLDSGYILQTSINKPWGGITVADAQLINDHATSPFLTSLPLKAADVTGDSQVLANDAQQTARRAANLGIQFSFDQSRAGNWVDDTAQIIMSGNHIVQNLNVLSRGDVNASYSPVLRKGTDIFLESRGKINSNSEDLAIPIITESSYVLGSLQFEFEVPTGYRFTGVHSAISTNWVVNQHENKGIAIWFKEGVEGMKVFQGDRIMSLLFAKISDVNKASEIVLNTSGYQEFNDLNALTHASVKLSAPKVIFTKLDQIELYPNPSSDRTTLSINLEESKVIQITLNDLNGRIVSTLLSSTELPKGNNLIDLDTKELPTGTYYVKVNSFGNSNNSLMKRLVVIH
ncbi:MAG: T9SS C-terminal target domain-containing protein [Sphingobacteriia bacterium]|nr:T9SS C-terminal target domain-containing protein [Sphingobacteriia bacterium]